MIEEYKESRVSLASASNLRKPTVKVQAPAMIYRIESIDVEPEDDVDFSSLQRSNDPPKQISKPAGTRIAENEEDVTMREAPNTAS